mmetsp:Transcript_25845/g.53441  ORF Transcript_25845/g.53441 Transcript_25845/m.53441 type:complete len:481 (+) Transcript_25845:121-1563(+)
MTFRYQQYEASIRQIYLLATIIHIFSLVILLSYSIYGHELTTPLTTLPMQRKHLSRVSTLGFTGGTAQRRISTTAFFVGSTSLRSPSKPSYQGSFSIMSEKEGSASAKLTIESSSKDIVNSAPTKLRYVDAGANLLDSMYQGTYHDKTRHEPDLDIVLQRAYESGVHSIISLAGTPEESEQLLDLCENGVKYDIDGKHIVDDSATAVKMFGTVGVHPTRCAEVFATKSEGGPVWTLKSEEDRNEIMQQLTTLAKRGKQSGNVIAIGEFGLDYARLHFCPKEIQHVGFRAQLEVALVTDLPLYLHNRESGEDLMEILSEYTDRFARCQKYPDGDNAENRRIRGIVHSFDESLEIAKKFLSLGLYIGINGCSLKTQQNLDVVKDIPLESLILETDCPWCDIRPTHAGFSYIQTIFPCKKEKQYNKDLGKMGFCVKNRTEPCHVAQVAEVVAGLKGLKVKEVVDICCGKNVCELFGKLEKRSK